MREFIADHLMALWAFNQGHLSEHLLFYELILLPAVVGETSGKRFVRHPGLTAQVVSPCRLSNQNTQRTSDNKRIIGSWRFIIDIGAQSLILV